MMETTLSLVLDKLKGEMDFHPGLLVLPLDLPLSPILILTGARVVLI